MILSLLNVMVLDIAAAGVWRRDEKVAAVVAPLTGLAIALLVYQFVRRNPWPRPFRLRFVAMHAVVGLAAALAWNAISSTLVSILAPGGKREGSLDEFIFIGMIFYTIAAGISYAIEATGRAARAEALAARTQLAALRAQIHPHFLFNALHAVVQLIPVQPARAAEAAEMVADLLRTTLEDQRDVVTLADEWRFVSRYLDIERMRFGDRLVVRADIDHALLDERVPAFALQTLVENAVRHGAAHRVEPTEIAVVAARDGSELTLTVRNAVNGTVAPNGSGTGLSRLRERLAVLYGGAARVTSREGDGAFEAVLVVPRTRERDA